MEDARCELERFLIEDELRDCIFILLVNKQDLDNAMSVDEVRKALKFDEIKQTKIFLVQLLPQVKVSLKL
jgi:ADP-ribosylation factor protein 1/Arf/Sar family protein